MNVAPIDSATYHGVVVPRPPQERTSWTNVLPQDEPTKNATGLHDRPPEIAEVLRDLLASAKDEIFEDDLESEFLKSLVDLIKKYGDDAIAELAYFVIYEKGSVEVIGEVLRELGLISDPKTYSFRRWLLEASLHSSSLWIRDGGALGLAFLDDPHAIPFLKEVINREIIDEIRGSLQQVLAQLESTDQCQRS